MPPSFSWPPIRRFSFLGLIPGWLHSPLPREGTAVVSQTADQACSRSAGGGWGGGGLCPLTSSILHNHFPQNPGKGWLTHRLAWLNVATPAQRLYLARLQATMWSSAYSCWETFLPCGRLWNFNRIYPNLFGKTSVGMLQVCVSHCFYTLHVSTW